LCCGRNQSPKSKAQCGRSALKTWVLLKCNNIYHMSRLRTEASARPTPPPATRPGNQGNLMNNEQPQTPTAPPPPPPPSPPPPPPAPSHPRPAARVVVPAKAKADQGPSPPQHEIPVLVLAASRAAPPPRCVQNPRSQGQGNARATSTSAGVSSSSRRFGFSSCSPRGVWAPADPVTQSAAYVVRISRWFPLPTS
jgi:hypothetical protein